MRVDYDTGRKQKDEEIQVMREELNQLKAKKVNEASSAQQERNA